MKLIHNLPHSPVRIRRNGFVFTFSAEADDDVFGIIESTYGSFTDTFEEGAIPHDVDNHRTPNWFVAVHLPTVEEVMEYQVTTRSEAMATIRRYAQQNYKRAASHGVDWDYYSLFGSVSIDDPLLGSIKLAQVDMTGIEEIDSNSEVEGLIEDMIHDLLPKAFAKSAEYAKAFSEMTIGLNVEDRTITRVEPVEEAPVLPKIDIAKDVAGQIDDIIEDLEEYGATFISFGLREHMTSDSIRRWVNDTKALSGEELNEFGLPDTPLDEIYDRADAISARLLQNPEYK